MNSIELYNGVIMPNMAVGTNWMTYRELKPVLRSAFKNGFRAIDTARDYGNEDVVGHVVMDLLKELNIKREDIFITTKIGNSQQIEGNIEEEIEKSLNNLRTNYLDLWLMHWPYPGCYIHTWRKMEQVYKSGKVKAIGVANYDLRHLKTLFSSGIKITPMVNQIEYHPLRTINHLRPFMQKNGIAIQAYAPLCRLVAPLKESILLNDLAKKYQKTLGQILLRWHIQQGYVMPVFKTYTPTRFIENKDIYDFELTAEEMNNIFSLNRDYKYHLESINCPGY